MAQLPRSVCKALALARRNKGLTQSALALSVGCKQSAISMLEAGQAGKISQESVEKIAELLGVGLPREASQPPLSQELERSAPPRVGFCPNAHCFSNIPYVVNGELLFWPKFQPLLPEGETRCIYCGELLERQCPSCGASLDEGACCRHCGTPLVTNVLAPEIPVELWAAERRHEIAEWRQLTRNGKEPS